MQPYKIQDGQLTINDPKLIGEHSFSFFLSHYLEYHFYENFGKHHKLLIADLQNIDDYKRIVQAFPREHAKTTIVSFGFVLWCICYTKRKNIVMASDTKDQAIQFLSAIRTELEVNEKINADFGNLIGKEWQKTRLQTSNNIRVSAVSTNSSTRGSIYNAIEKVTIEGKVHKIAKLTRPDLIICDDILNEKLVKNAQLRQKVKDWYRLELLNLLNSDTGWLIVIGTIFHKDDLLVNMLENTDGMTQGWRNKTLPACEMTFDANGSVLSVTNILWAEYWTERKLLQRRKDIGSVAFAREFLLKIVDKTLQYFRKENWIYYDQRNLPKDLVVCTVIDPAVKDTESSDFTVITTIGYSPQTCKFYILQVDRVKTTPYKYITLLLDQCEKYNTLYDHVGVCIETVAFQYTLCEPIEREMQRRNIYTRMFTVSPTSDKVLRISKVSPYQERGEIALPIEEKYQGWVEYLVTEEAESFPMSKHDDILDTIHMGLSMLAPYTNLIRKGEMLEEPMLKPFGY